MSNVLAPIPAPVPWLARVLGVVLLILGFVMLAAGGLLASLGGSWFYALSGLAWALIGALMWGRLREAVLGLGLNERDVPGIAQLFGHPTTLLELEPPVRRREMVWSTLRALERIASLSPVTIVCEDIDRFDHPSLEILRRARDEGVSFIAPPLDDVLTLGHE